MKHRFAHISLLQLLLLAAPWWIEGCKKNDGEIDTSGTTPGLLNSSTNVRQGSLALGVGDDKSKNLVTQLLTSSGKNEGSSVLTPRIAMGGSSAALITWVQNIGAEKFAVFKSAYLNGNWIHPAGSSDHLPLVGVASNPQVAMDSSGNGISVWQQSDGTNIKIFKAEYRDGVWSTPSTVSNAISPSGSDASLPQVAMDSQGNAIIVWEQKDENAISQIFKSEYRASTWSNPRNLSDNISPNVQNAHNAQVAMDSAGNAVIVWSQSDGSGAQIFKSDYRNGVWVHPAGLNDYISPKL